MTHTGERLNAVILDQAHSKKNCIEKLLVLVFSNHVRGFHELSVRMPNKLCYDQPAVFSISSQFGAHPSEEHHPPAGPTVFASVRRPCLPCSTW